MENEHTDRATLYRTRLEPTVGPPPRDLALSHAHVLESGAAHQASELDQSELPQVVGRLAQHDVAAERAGERRPGAARERVCGDRAPQVELPARSEHARHLA